MEYQSKVFIFNNDEETVKLILSMFKGINKINYYDDVVEYEKTKQQQYNEDRKENRQAMKFITLCPEIMSLKKTDLQQEKKNRKGEVVFNFGFYAKSKISKHLGITSKSQFNDKVLKDLDVIDYLKRHNIINKGQSLNFTKAI